jgi:hypothetical protein
MPCGMLGEATTPWLRLPRHQDVRAQLQPTGRRVTKGAAARSKSRPPSCPDFYSFHNPGNGVCKLHNYYAHKALRCTSPCTWSENYIKSRRTLTSSAAISTHATAMAMHFPANAGLIFRTDELTDRYLVDTGATLSIVPCTANSSPSGPLLKGEDGQPIPSWGFIKKYCLVSRQTFHF